MNRMFIPSDNLYVEALPSNVIEFGGEAFGKSWWRHEGGASWMQLAPLKNLPPLCSPSVRTQEGGCLQPWRGSSPEPDRVGTLILDFQHSELWEINVYCLSHLVYGIFGIAAQAKTHTKGLKQIFFNFCTIQSFPIFSHLMPKLDWI